jgi:hypothetical protein
VKTAFGLDIAGYAGGNSGFARADIGSDRVIRVTVYDGHVFGSRLKGADPLGTVAEAEQQVLRACCKIGDVLVDTPVDLQGLPCPVNPFFTWELVKRPVDYAFDALAPLANLIGAPVARFQNMLSALREEKSSEGFDRVYETYPAASLKLLGLWSSGYGSQSMRFAGGRWEGGPLGGIANNLEMKGKEGDAFDGDDFDAALCAITGVVAEDAHLRGEGLSREVYRRIKARVAPRHHAWISASVPKNYILMKTPPEKEIRVVKKQVSGPEGTLREVTAERSSSMPPT